MKMKLLFSIVTVVSAVLFLGIGHETLAQLTYQPLETIPGSTATGSFPTYVENIYKFALWAVGIAALLMFTIGGFMYMTSAGNAASISRAKNIIKDSLIGVILALLAYLILYVINPDLVNVNLSKFSEVGGTVPASPATVPPIDQTTTPYSAQPGLNAATPSGAGTAWPDDSFERKQLKDAGISINKPNCKTVGQANCSSVYGLHNLSIKAIKELSDDCNCKFILNGATEYWLHGNRATNNTNKTKHVPGNGVIDVAKGSALDKYIKKKGSIVCYLSKKDAKGNKFPATPVYKINIYIGPVPAYTAYFWDEDPVHWHADMLNNNLCP